MILSKANKFKAVLLQIHGKTLPSEVKEDFDTHFTGLQAVIRNFRNEAGHPTGKVLDREQVFVLLSLFIPYAKKMEQVAQHLG